MKQGTVDNEGVCWRNFYECIRKKSNATGPPRIFLLYLFIYSAFVSLFYLFFHFSFISIFFIIFVYLAIYFGHRIQLMSFSNTRVSKAVILLGIQNGCVSKYFEFGNFFYCLRVEVYDFGILSTLVL